MKPIALIQARVGSSRLPGKVLAPIGAATMLERVVDRCRMSRALGGIAIITSELEPDDAVIELATSLGIDAFRGSEHDVLDRYVRAIETWGIQTVVRITADCPLVDPAIIDDLIDRQASSGVDYVGFNGYPNGLDAEVVTGAALHRAHQETRLHETYYREHVTTYLLDHPEAFRLDLRPAPAAVRRPDLRLSVDEAADLEVARFVYANMPADCAFDTAEIVRLLDAHPEVVRINAHVQQKAR